MTNDYVGEICNDLNQTFANAVRGIAQPLADTARNAMQEVDQLRHQVGVAFGLLNQTQVASRGEIENEPGLIAKVSHLVFIAEAAERAESELREEVNELRGQLADLAFTFAEVSGRHAYGSAA